MRSVAVALLVVCIAVTSSAAVPRLIMPSDDGGDAVVLSAASVRVTIRGHLARTEYELTFRNRLPRIVGGDFVFPLPPDGEVSDLGLYFDGKLRHAVAVERVLAKRAYQETVHGGVDPALAEWSDSRAFRMRLYPIPADGEKRIFIACDQELVSNDYLLDLRFKQKLDAFTLAIDSDVQPVIADGLALSAGKAQLANAVLDATVAVRRDENDVALTAWSARDQAWFVSAPLHVGSAERPFEPAAHVTLLWDASGSSVQQNGPRLRAFLDHLLRRQAAWAMVTVIPFHLWVDEARDTTPRDLARTLDAIDLAGATNLTAMLQQLPSIAARAPASRLVLVTDGINSMGDAQRLAAAAASLGAMRRPLTVVNAAPRADETLLRSLAETTGGRYVDLTTTSPADAAERAMLRPTRIELPGFAPRAATTAGAPRIVIAARTATRPSVVAAAGRELPVRDVDAAGLVIRAWARAHLRELSAPEEIAELGKRYTMLTPRTSLLVLESWWDYEMYGIDMPEDVAAAKAREQEQSAVPLAVAAQSRPAAPQFQGTAAWFVKGSVLEPSGGALPGVTVTLEADGAIVSTVVTDANGHFWLPAHAAPAKFTIRAELEGFNGAVRQFDAAPTGGNVELTMRTAAVAETITVTASPSFEIDGVVETTAIPRASVIGPADLQLADDVARAGREIEKAPLERRHEIVLELIRRVAALRSPAARMHEYAMARAVAGGEKQLHLGVAEALRADDAALALRVLTDLAEAYADDAPIVRIVARIADGWGRADVARELLLHALDVSPSEPQTWRELMLLARRARRPAEAAALTARFNAVSKAGHLRLPPDALDLEVHDNADLQIDVMWECDYCDIDLHVVEPGGEEVMYNHRKSKHGGELSADITGGFGPEIYAIARAPRGPYKVVLEYYGDDQTEISAETLVHVIVITRGRFGVHRRDHTLLLSHKKERMDVATVELE